jgi:hypothetical protein
VKVRHVEGAKKVGDGSLIHSHSKDVDLPRTPHYGWKTGQPSPEKPVQTKKPKYQEVK